MWTLLFVLQIGMGPLHVDFVVCSTDRHGSVTCVLVVCSTERHRPVTCGLCCLFYR